MITPKLIAEKTMTPEKRSIAYNDFFAFYVGRPLSYLLTIPFLYLGTKPITITLISMIAPILGLLFFVFGHSMVMFIIGWICFFLWNLLDGVDGNVARYTNNTSKIGSVYDAMSGYEAMALIFLAVGVCAEKQNGIIGQVVQMPATTYVILGAISGMTMIFPRLIMHKALSTLGEAANVGQVKDKSSYGIIRIIALNLGSVTGGPQVFMILAILTNQTQLFTIFYFIFNICVMLVSLKSILSD